MVRPASIPVRARRGNAQRLLAAFAEVRPHLLASLAQQLGSADDALDALQDAFLKCWRRRDRVHEVGNLRGWIYRVALNAGRDLQRNVWRRRSRPLGEPLLLADRPGNLPAEQLVHDETLRRLGRALLDLRPEERAVFLLRQNSDLTYDEIAARRRVPVGTVKTQMRTALQKLRRVLQEPPDAA
jgi:RNA polymerase sigma-70 factor (ECF subfamily)